MTNDSYLYGHHKRLTTTYLNNTKKFPNLTSVWSAGYVCAGLLI
jgi:hypothetical protein